MYVQTEDPTDRVILAYHVPGCESRGRLLASKEAETGSQCDGDLRCNLRGHRISRRPGFWNGAVRSQELPERAIRAENGHVWTRRGIDLISVVVRLGVAREQPLPWRTTVLLR